MSNTISFKQFLTEAFHSSFKSQSSKTDVEVFENPSSKEINDTKSIFGDSRAILHGDKIYMWKATDALHHEVRKHAGLSGPDDTADLVINHRNKTIAETGRFFMPGKARRQAVLNHPQIQKKFKDYKVV